MSFAAHATRTAHSASTFRAPTGEKYGSLPTMAAQEIEIEQHAHEPTRPCWENTTFIQMESMSKDGSVPPAAPVKGAFANPRG